MSPLYTNLYSKKSAIGLTVIFKQIRIRNLNIKVIVNYMPTKVIKSKLISVCLINDYSLIADLHIFVYGRAKFSSISL